MIRLVYNRIHPNIRIPDGTFSDVMYYQVSLLRVALRIHVAGTHQKQPVPVYVSCIVYLSWVTTCPG